MNNLTEQLMKYEYNQLTDEETIQLFQHLVNTGLAWQLQGSYGRTAQSMIDNGIVSPASEEELWCFDVACQPRGGKYVPGVDPRPGAC